MLTFTLLSVEELTLISVLVTLVLMLLPLPSCVCEAFTFTVPPPGEVMVWWVEPLAGMLMGWPFTVMLVDVDPPLELLVTLLETPEDVELELPDCVKVLLLDGGVLLDWCETCKLIGVFWLELWLFIGVL